MASAGLLDRVSALLQDPCDVALARSIFGTADAASITRRVERFCAEQLGRAVASCEEVTQSVGAVFVLTLADEERVVLKFHALGAGRLGTVATLAEMHAVYAVQAALARSGVPCAPILHPPVTCVGGAVVVMAPIDGSGGEDARLPEVRRAMVESYVELGRHGRALRETPALPVARLPDTLWPIPHNVLFDLAAPGGDWIDERARQARAVLDAATPPRQLLHTDFSAANVRVRAGRVRAIYDMDSVALVDEMCGLASAAVHHTYAGSAAPATSRDEARAFVRDYELCRGQPLTRDERTRLDAAALYALAYTARCEHSGDPAGARLAGSVRERLRAAPPAGYLD